MKGRLVRIILPLLMGLLAVLVTQQYIKAQVKAAPVPVMGTVVVARGPVAGMTVLTESMLTTRQVPQNFIGPHDITTVKDAAGQVSLFDLAEGEVLTRQKLSGPPEKAALSFRIPEGMRAVTLRIDEISGVGGYPQVGDHVDVIVSLPERSQGGQVLQQAEARMVFENVLVLAKGPASQVKSGQAPAQQVATGQDPRFSSLTVALYPRQAVEAALAEDLGRIKVVLRPALPEDLTGELRVGVERFRGDGPSSTIPGGPR